MVPGNLFLRVELQVILRDQAGLGNTSVVVKSRALEPDGSGF